MGAPAQHPTETRAPPADLLAVPSPIVKRGLVEEGVLCPLQKNNAGKRRTCAHLFRTLNASSLEGVYSWRRASMGSSRDARRAGYQPNRMPTPTATARDKNRDGTCSLAGKVLSRKNRATGGTQ